MAEEPKQPVDYSEELGIAICEALMEPKSLRKICEAEGMPNKSTVFKWLARGDAGEEPFAAFRKRYEAARCIQADAHVDETTDIADEAPKTPEGIAHAKLRISTRQWNAEKLRPKKYGSKVAHIGGDEGDAPVKAELAIRFV